MVIIRFLFLIFLAIVVLPFQVFVRATTSLAAEDPDPVQILPINSGSNAGTIPAFPEQSAETSATSICPLNLSSSSALLQSVHHSCSISGGFFPLKSRCCPAIYAWLLEAYSTTSLEATTESYPVLPNDSEACAQGAEAALRERGERKVLSRVNATCDAVYCYCGVRLRRLRCSGSNGVFETVEGRWSPTKAAAEMLEQECKMPGIAGCSRCLKALNQLKSGYEASNTTKAIRKKGAVHDNQCQFMGLTWLLTKNPTAYMSTVTAVLGAFMASPDNTPVTCALPHNDMPMAVDSAQLEGYKQASAIRPLALASLPYPVHLLVLLVLSYLF